MCSLWAPEIFNYTSRSLTNTLGQRGKELGLLFRGGHTARCPAVTSVFPAVSSARLESQSSDRPCLSTMRPEDVTGPRPGAAGAAPTVAEGGTAFSSETGPQAVRTSFPETSSGPVSWDSGEREAGESHLSS